VPLSPSSAARLATQLECLPSLLEGHAPEALQRRTRSGKWSVHENLAHMARHHAVVLDRVRKVLAEDRPALPRYAAEEDPEWPAWAALSADEILTRLRTLRMELTALVAGLPDEALARTAIHPSLGEMTLRLWIEFFLLHEAHHLYLVMKRARGGE
jgi:uncharacterized damage-inducible protein DinB